jgi:hypothetical protein
MVSTGTCGATPVSAIEENIRRNMRLEARSRSSIQQAWPR